MLSEANEIQDYKWIEGRLYRPAADSGPKVEDSRLELR